MVHRVESGNVRNKQHHVELELGSTIVNQPREPLWKRWSRVLIVSVIVLLIILLLPARHACVLKGYIPVEEIHTDLLTRSTNGDKYYSKAERQPVCSLSPVGKLPVLPLYPETVSNDDVKALPSIIGISVGGHGWPTSCRAQINTAVIIPYRDRPEQLNAFLWYMHQFLTIQQINYTIYVVEQSVKYRFNRAKLFNVGFTEVLSLNSHDCFIFHDVDLLPENVQSIYGCSRHPRHLVSALNTFRYNLPYCTLFGGAVALTRDQFEKVNGFSNRFFGWGGEDDDFSLRVDSAGYSITRWDPSFARYSMMIHKKELPNSDRYNLVRTGTDYFQADGLHNVKYKRLHLEEKPLYTWILVDI